MRKLKTTSSRIGFVLALISGIALLIQGIPIFFFIHVISFSTGIILIVGGALMELGYAKFGGWLNLVIGAVYPIIFFIAILTIVVSIDTLSIIHFILRNCIPALLGVISGAFAISSK